MENSIEKTIKIIERKIKEAEHYTDITGLCLTLDKELCNAFINILSDYKKVLKENEELKRKNKTLEELLQGNLYELYKYYRELAGSYQGNCILAQKAKDKIEELNRKIDKSIDNSKGGLDE